MSASSRSPTEEYQRRAFDKLERLFGEGNVEKEWDVGKGSQDSLTRELYCPRIDLAVGPFNTNRHMIEQSQEEIEHAISHYRQILQRLFSHSEERTGSIGEFLGVRNRNPRCFIAIEIEHSGTRKHMLGDIANASIMGAIGIVVPLTDEKMRGFKKMKKYVEFATTVGKLRPSFRNVLIVSKDRFLEVLSA